MAYMIGSENSSLEASILSFSLYFPYTNELKDIFLSLGYEQCSGSAANEGDIRSWEVRPFEKKFWRQKNYPNIKFEIKTFTSYEAYLEK